jgi:hypothetical protein
VSRPRADNCPIANWNIMSSTGTHKSRSALGSKYNGILKLKNQSKLKTSFASSKNLQAWPEWPEVPLGSLFPILSQFWPTAFFKLRLEKLMIRHS